MFIGAATTPALRATPPLEEGTGASNPSRFGPEEVTVAETAAPSSFHIPEIAPHGQSYFRKSE
jgi:hypothetical protein